MEENNSSLNKIQVKDEPQDSVQKLSNLDLDTEELAFAEEDESLAKQRPRVYQARSERSVVSRSCVVQNVQCDRFDDSAVVLHENNSRVEVTEGASSIVTCDYGVDPGNGNIREGEAGIVIKNSSNVHLTVGGHAESRGVLDDCILEMKIKKTKDVFAKTETMRRVERILKEENHVTLSGASGEGKTSLALMLGVKYRKKGYDLVFVSDVDQLRLSEVISTKKKVFLILDDIFGSVGLSTDVPHLRSVLHDLKICLEDRTPRSSQASQLNVKVVLTTKSYNLEVGMKQLDGQEFFFFKGTSLIDLTNVKMYRYSREERQQMIQMHMVRNGLELDLDEIHSTEDTIFGFPLTCRLFFEFHDFQSDPKKFFSEPLFYLRRELEQLISKKNQQSAAFVLMLLLDGRMNLKDVECKSPSLANKFLSLRSFITDVTGIQVAGAVRSFRGTFFTHGDVIEFSHPVIYDACACALYKHAPAFVLENCSLKFLYERVHQGQVGGTTVSDHHHVIYVSEAYNDIIANRLAVAISEGKYSMSVTHQILKRKEIVDKIFDILRFEKTNFLDRLLDTQKSQREKMLHSKEGGKHLLYWAVHAHSLYLVEKVLTIGHTFTDGEIADAFEACAVSGNVAVLKYLFTRFKTVKEVVLLQVLSKSVEHDQQEVFDYLLEVCGGVAQLLTHDDSLLVTACNNSSLNTLRRLVSLLCEHANLTAIPDDPLAALRTLLRFAIEHKLMQIANYVVPVCNVNQRADGRTLIMLATMEGDTDMYFLLRSRGADIGLVDLDSNTVLHLACIGGFRHIVEDALQSVDVNARGVDDITPLTLTVIHRHVDVFATLLSRGADAKLADKNDNNALHHACLVGFHEVILDLLQLSDVNARGEKGLTPIMIAVKQQDEKLSHLLLRHGADCLLKDQLGNPVLNQACIATSMAVISELVQVTGVNIRGEDGRTPIMEAVRHHRTILFHFLLSKGADVSLTDNKSNSVFHHACIAGDYDIVLVLVAEFDINTIGERGRSALMLSARNNRVAVFDTLMRLGADVCQTDNDGNTVVHHIAIGGSVEMTYQEQIWPYWAAGIRGVDDMTPIMLSARHGNVDLFDFLVNMDADLLLVDRNGNNVFHHACAGGDLDTVARFVGLFDVNIKGENAMSPLMIAALNQRKEVFGFLLEMEASIYQKDSLGNCVLHYACTGGNQDIVLELWPALDVDEKGDGGQTSLMRAAKHNHLHIVHLLLLSLNADASLKDDSGNTVLHQACISGDLHVIKMLMETEDSLCNIDTQGWCGMTPLMLAARYVHQDVITYLLSSGANPALHDEGGSQALHHACEGGSEDIVQMLLPLSDINTRRGGGITPLMIAAKACCIQVFELLIAKGADTSVTDNDGNDALFYACIGGDPGIISLLSTLEDSNCI